MDVTCRLHSTMRASLRPSTLGTLRGMIGTIEARRYKAWVELMSEVGDVPTEEIFDGTRGEVVTHDDWLDV